MYFIYKITNNINGKIYIGSSTVERGYDKRWQEHKASSKYTNGKCYNYPLYKAIRKYGEENFDYEIIEDNIITLEERAHREKFYILKYNSINRDKGYNQTLETECALKDNRVKSTKEYMKKCALVNNKNEIIILF